MAVHELAANSVRHGAGHGQLRIWADGSALYCQVTDGQVTADGGAQAADGPGSPARQAAGQAAGWQIEHGHGLWLVHQVADQARLHGGPGGSSATVTFLLRDPG